jgi:hypothetical protein
MHTARSLKNITNHIVFHTKIQAYILGFNDQFIKTFRVWPIFQKTP